MAENELIDPALDAQHDQAPLLPPRLPQRQNPALQFIRAPPILKFSNDLDTYLRRFDSYIRSIGAAPEEIPHILINSLDDEVMSYIERHLVDGITLPELIRVLRQELGFSRLNREEFKAKLRRTLRTRNEDIRSYYSKLWNLAKKAYPDNEQVRNANLRDTFIANFQDSAISARLRERPEITNEQLLDLAVTLYNCKQASLSRQSEVNLTETVSPTIEQKLDQVIGLLANVQIPAPQTERPQSDSSIYVPNSQGNYRYNGDRRSVGLPVNTPRTDSYWRGRGRPFNNYRRNYNPQYVPSGARRNQYNQGQNRRYQNYAQRGRGFSAQNNFNRHF